jgi:ABC-2 type transport system ATP-binding protein
MNLMTGLLRPSRGRITVRGISPDQPERLFRILGYCTQYDAFPRGFTGFQFVYAFLRVHGYGAEEAHDRAWSGLEKVKLTKAASRKIAGYSKGMRQRIKLAQAISHSPQVLVLDEPLNGLDPMARAEVIGLFQELAGGGAHVLVSSHILHEVDMISDQVVMLNGGYVVAEGDIPQVREEMPEHPIQVLVRCDRPGLLASRLFELDHVVEVKIQEDGGGLLIRTRNADSFYRKLNQAVLETGLEVEAVAPADEDVHSVYQYLIGANGGGSA